MEYSTFIIKHPKMRELDPDNIPTELKISTMTLTCKLPVIFDVFNIAKELQLSTDFIHCVKCGNSSEVARSLLPLKKKKVKKTKKPSLGSAKNFYNQATLVIYSKQEGDDNYIKLNIKLFKNGAIQITGCKKISYAMWALYRLFKIFRYREHRISEETVVISSYAHPKCFLNILGLQNFRIAMINSNFKISFKIDREKLFKKMTLEKYDCSYDPARHAGVHIRYKVEGAIKPVSLFVFDAGSIIITGVRTYKNLMEVYKFINIYLLENYAYVAQS